MTAEGGDQHRLTKERGDPSTPAGLQYQVDPAWSPDGTKIAFASARERVFDIYVMNADGNGSRRLTSSSSDDRYPSWSPDGKRIAFARSSDGGHIWAMSADGKGAKRVTDDLAPEDEPAWSPEEVDHRLCAADAGDAISARSGSSTPTAEAGVPSRRCGPSADRSGVVAGRVARRVLRESRRHRFRHLHDAVRRKGTTICRRRDRRRRRAGLLARRKEHRVLADGAINVRGPDGRVEELTDPARQHSSPAWKPVPPS